MWTAGKNHKPHLYSHEQLYALVLHARTFENVYHCSFPKAQDYYSTH